MTPVLRLMTAVLPALVLTALFTGCLSQKSAQSVPPVRSERGGFSFVPPRDWSIEEHDGTVFLLSPGGDALGGPAVLLESIPLDRTITLEKAAEVARKTYSDVEFSAETRTQVNGREGILLSYEAVFHAPDGPNVPVSPLAEGEPLQGRILVLMLSEQRVFRASAVAPQNQWQATASVFEKLIDSLTFFDVD